MEESNVFLRSYLPLQGPGRSTALPDDWKYVKILLLMKSVYHTSDVDSALIAVSHHCGLLNVHQLLVRVETLRRQGRPTNTSNFMSHENEAPKTSAGWKTLAGNILNDSNHWLQFQFECLLVDIDNVSILGAVVSGKFAGSNLANTTYHRTYNFKVRVLAQNASEGAYCGDDLYTDVKLSHDEFLTQ